MLTAAQEQAAEERWAGVALEDPAVWGVTEIRDNGIVLRLALKRRTGHDDFDRALRERILLALDAIAVQQFPVTTVVQSEPAPRPASRRRTSSTGRAAPRL
jgi:hypothetical protein